MPWRFSGGSDDTIESIAAVHGESRNIGDTAIEQLTEKYLASQSLNLDAVSGAPLGSMAFATAVAACASQAGVMSGH